MKKAKNLGVALALALGLGVGFGVALVPGTAQANDCPGPAECTRNSDCDAKCGGPGSGVCQVWTCVCAA
jgi:hypothetical protein